MRQGILAPPFGIMLALAAFSPFGAGAAPLKPLTPEASIEMRRLESFNISDLRMISHSPDGKRYLLRVAQDDLKAGGTWVEFLSGRTDSLEAAKPISLGRLFTTAERNEDTGTIPPTHPATTDVIWVDNDRAVFRWSDGKNPVQLMLLDASKGEVRKLTNHKTSVTSFGIAAPDRRTILYTLYPGVNREAEDRALRGGYVVRNPDALSTVLSGVFTSGGPWQNVQPYVINLDSGKSRRIACTDLTFCTYHAMAALGGFSPDYKLMAVRWAYSMDKLQWRILRFDPESASLVEIWRQRGRALGGSALWFPSSDRVIVGPIQTHPDSNPSRHAVIEVEPSTGRIWELPVPADLSPVGQLHRWRDDGIVEVREGSRILAFRKAEDAWQRLPEVPPSPETEKPAPVRIEVRQDLNTPPRVYAVDQASGRERLLLDVEPRLKDYALGRVEVVNFTDAEGTVWEGKLVYPVGYKPGGRYPMVINLTYADEWKNIFSLTGLVPNLGPVYAAQALANRGMAALILDDNGPGIPGYVGTSREGMKITLAVEAAVNHFVKKGLAQPDKIGLAGFSRSGSHVEQAITRSSYPFAAAIASDNVDFSYVQAVLKYGMRGEDERVNGAFPYGEGLQKWFENAPGFNAHKVRTPLRIEVISGGVGGLMMGWEMYARLHYLNKPVELVLVPEPDKALHAPQMPVQKLFSQGGAVDWFDFWLNGREDPAPHKAAQYERWRKLRQQQEASVAKTVAARAE